MCVCGKEGEGGGGNWELGIGRGQQTQASEWHGSEVGVSVVERSVFGTGCNGRSRLVLWVLSVTLLFDSSSGWEIKNLVAVEKLK